MNDFIFTNKEINNIISVLDKNAKFDINFTKTDINVFGPLAPISRELLKPPTITLKFNNHKEEKIIECYDIKYHHNYYELTVNGGYKYIIPHDYK